MPASSYQIRVCPSCGLRYPLVDEHPFGTRCPACLGSTQVASTHPLQTENLIPLRDITFAHKLSALLDNIRSAWNVGSIFRTADGFGLRNLHLCGITPTPETEALKKTSLSAETTVKWIYHKNALLAAKQLKAGGCKLIALEDNVRAIPITDASQWDEEVVLVVGNEITGVDPELLELCDEILYIPMRGTKKSLNVAVAFAIAVSQLCL